MKLIFLVAFVYLLIEFFNRKDQDATNKNDFEKAFDKAANTIDEVVEETKDALRTPAKKSVIDVQSLDTVLPSTPVEETVEREIISEIPSKSKELIPESTIEEVQRFIDDSVITVKEPALTEQIESLATVSPANPSTTFQSGHDQTNQTSEEGQFKGLDKENVHCFIDEIEVPVEECDMEPHGEGDDESAAAESTNTSFRD